MGNLLALLAPPVDTPRFDFPPLEDRTRMLESSYNMLFGKLALKSLFEDYFNEARHFTTRIMLKPLDDPRVDLTATFSQTCEETIVGNAQFRLQSDVLDPHTFVDVSVSNTKPILLMRFCTYSPTTGLGTFSVFPLLWKQRLSLDNDCFIGYRYASSNLSVGATQSAFSSQYEEFPRTAWLVSKIGRLTAGVQYEPKYGSKGEARYKDLENWSCAVGYGVGSGSPLRPSFNFGLELNRSSQFIASFYQHLVFQRQVMNPIDGNNVGITNYIDFGFEIQSSRIHGDKPTNNYPDSSFQAAASWQANKNFLFKGKFGNLASSLALAFKSWWEPSFSFSLSAVRDHIKGETAYGFGIHVDNIRESYERAGPKSVIPTPIKEYFPEGIYWKIGGRRFTFRGFDGINRELISHSLDKIL